MATKKTPTPLLHYKSREAFCCQCRSSSYCRATTEDLFKTRGGSEDSDVVTTDFFAFDDSTNSYGLKGLGTAVEMGDAVLGLVIEKMGASAPRWAAIRNASDPQIDSSGLTLPEAANKAAQIYEKYGYWTTIPSAITCWAAVKDN